MLLLDVGRPELTTYIAGQSAIAMTGQDALDPHFTQSVKRAGTPQACWDCCSSFQVNSQDTWSARAGKL